MTMEEGQENCNEMIKIRALRHYWPKSKGFKSLQALSKLAPAFWGLFLGVRPLYPLPQAAYAGPSSPATTGTTATPPVFSVTSPNFPPTQAAADTDDLFDEVWKLTSKFYLDRSFGGNDWGQARADLRSQGKLPGDSASETMATKKLLKKLGDKYTQLLSPYMYMAMSRFDPIGAGFMLSVDDDGYFCVSSDPRDGTRAAKERVEKGDKILEIEGVAIKGKSVFDAVDLITKEDKTDVRLTIQSKRDPAAAPRVLTLPREFNTVSNPGRAIASRTKVTGVVAEKMEGPRKHQAIVLSLYRCPHVHFQLLHFFQSPRCSLPLPRTGARSGM